MNKPWMETAICVAMNFAGLATSDRFVWWLSGAVTTCAIVQWVVWRAHRRAYGVDSPDGAKR
jgi:hypothetical protein